MQKIKELALQVTKEMELAGYSPITIWKLYAEVLIPLVRKHEARGTEYFDIEIISEYRQQIIARQASGTIKRNHSSKLLDGLNKLTRLNDTGKLEWSCPAKISKYKLNKYYEVLLDKYISNFNIHPNTRDDVTWVARKFLRGFLKIIMKLWKTYLLAKFKIL